MDIRKSTERMSFPKSYYFFMFLQLYSCLPTQGRHGQGVGVDKQKLDRRRKEDGRGLKTGKNEPTSFTVDPICGTLLYCSLCEIN